MRGGSIPILAWSALLLVLFIGNWIWDDKAVNAATAAFAALVIFAFAVAVAVRSGRQALQKGPPAPESEPQPLPEASLAAVLVGLSLGCILFGVVWAKFLVFFGAAMLILSLGRLVLELRDERRSRSRAGEERLR